MLKKYLKTAFCIITNSFTHALMNVLGLGIGIIMFFLTFLLNAYNTEFNVAYNNQKSSNLYRIEYLKFLMMVFELYRKNFWERPMSIL